MNAERLLTHYERIADAPDGVAPRHARQSSQLLGADHFDRRSKDANSIARRHAAHVLQPLVPKLLIHIQGPQDIDESLPCDNFQESIV
jgi:hypothetical protein